MPQTRRLEPMVLMLAAVLTLALPRPAPGSPSQDLARLANVYWEGQLKAHPTMATSIGDRRYDDRLEDNTPAGIAAEERRLQWVLGRARPIDEKRLDPADRLTRSALIEDVQDQLAVASCHFEDWRVDPLDGPQVDFMNLPDITTIATFKDAQNYVARCKAMGRYMDVEIANLRSGLKKGRTVSVQPLSKALDELQALNGKPVEEWPLAQPLEKLHKDWTASQREWFRKELISTERVVVKPAMKRYQDFLRTEIAPHARPQDRAGLVALQGGADSYRKLIRVETSLDRSPEDLHRLGLAEVARIRKELSALGKKVLGTGDVARIQKKLRSDPAMHFKNAAEVEAKARQALARARAAIPRYFGLLPKAGCEVKVMGMHEAPNSTIAYYRNPAADGSRPGYYMINTYQPTTRPRYEAEALAFHESIPGHHLQIAIAQELTGVPEFRKHQGVTAFVEGWGLYSERLADEMGLYSGDLDQIGMLSYDAWRACRLVVDTGIHSMGWSRKQAIDYMVDNTVLAENNIANEVDRYITWPAQALAYKCGQLEILRLREEAKQKLGRRFDIKKFHDAVLENGAVALPLLREQVEAWVAEESGGK
ncbi:MAG: DUF885 domain-containing protein [Candidatus Eisenbacteria bacterium]|uniref:DUF885 domain-containing protein n=1 Tax=Eiseniibacteriota bacterium TaxID=2212470 RepID=A0A538SLL8_UNCEI|nr:MAG: DUF885 domain-containing protein [Candidatus Eisenbacteria bacterium]